MRNPIAAAVLSLCLAATSYAAPRTSLLVLNKGDGTMSIIDPVSLETTATVPVGKNPHEALVSADGKTAWASNYNGAHTLGAVDVANGKALDPIDLGALVTPHGLALAGGKIYFTAEDSRAIGWCDPANGKVEWIMGSGQDKTHMIRLSQDGNTIFTTNIGSNTVSILTRAGKNWDIAQVKVGNGPEGFDISADGKELWVANSSDGSVSLVDIASKKVTATIDAGTKRSNRLEFTTDGKSVFVSDLEGRELVIIDTASHEITKRIALDAGAAGILMQPDGAKAYIALPNKKQIAVLDMKSLEVTARIATGTGPDGMAWSVIE